MNTEPTRKRYGRLFPQTLQDSVQPMLKQAAARRGFTRHELILSRWEEIVGKEIAAIAQPNRLSRHSSHPETFALHLTADAAHALDLQHITPHLLEMIQRYTGSPTVTQIKINY